MSLNSKQTINQTSNIISTNKSWKQCIQIKKLNQTNTGSFVLAQQNYWKGYKNLIKSLQ